MPGRRDRLRMPGVNHIILEEGCSMLQPQPRACSWRHMRAVQWNKQLALATRSLGAPCSVPLLLHADLPRGRRCPVWRRKMRIDH